MSSFFTRTGDDGYTGLLKEGRVAKYHPIPDTVGALDEATASLGLARSMCQSEQTRQLILTIQRDLYSLMAEISASPDNAERFRKIDGNRVAWLEEQTDLISQVIDIPKEFIVPGDSMAGAALSLARTIVRRAERQTAYLVHEHVVENNELLHYLNRLSSLCFVLELFENQVVGKVNPTLAKD